MSHKLKLRNHGDPQERREDVERLFSRAGDRIRIPFGAWKEVGNY
jgi:hypothetical protein